MHLSSESPSSKIPFWLWAAATLGILWNAYGAYQFIASFQQTTASLMATGMTQAQAEIYLGLPAWISIVFAVGVLGGLIGSFTLAARKAITVPIFAVSLVGYVFLFAGDTYHGVFAAIPMQLVILATVVVIAAALLAISVLAKKRGILA